MDIVAAVSNHVTKMVSSGGTAGPAGKMKVLLLDSETVCEIALGCRKRLTPQVSIISTAVTQSTLLSHEVYLIEYVPMLWISREGVQVPI